MASFAEAAVPPTPLLIREEEPIARHLPLRGDGTFERWVEVADEASLQTLIRSIRAEKLTIRPIPPFHDAMPPEGGLLGVALRLGEEFERIESQEDGTLRVGASVPLALLGLRKGFRSLERAPGTLMDAWEEGWLAPAMVKVRRYKGRGFEEGTDANPDPKALLVAAWLRPDHKLHPPRAGAAFVDQKVRGSSVRDVLQRVKLAGLRVHGAGFASNDPLVLVNRGDARPRQLRLLLAAVKERVQSATGVSLQERLAAPGRGGRL